MPRLSYVKSVKRGGTWQVPHFALCMKSRKPFISWPVSFALWATHASYLEVSAFTSKYDAWVAHKAKLTGQEMKGFRLFMHKAKCGTCHVPPRFTDFTYDNLGIPKNPLNPVYDWAGSS